MTIYIDNSLFWIAVIIELTRSHHQYKISIVILIPDWANPYFHFSSGHHVS